jgi:hypothetical protein
MIIASISRVPYNSNNGIRGDVFLIYDFIGKVQLMGSHLGSYYYLPTTSP